MSQLIKKDLRKEACRGIAKWYYNNALSFNAARDPLFADMFELVARHGPGCSIMSDGWTDKKKRSICNFLVNSPRGTVFVESIASGISKNTEKVFEMLDNIVNKVGEENVVQVVTDNASAYKAAGEKDFEKHMPVHKSTISKGRKVTNFIYTRTNLIAMMKEFTEGRDLVRPAQTRFATSYLTLGCLSEQKGNLMTMFSSDKWRKSNFASISEGKRIQMIVLDGRFWTNVVNCLRAAMPLVKVLRLVDSEEKPTMPFVVKELNEAKEKIKSNFGAMERK
ncbi:unnamed protein product [Linum tenue]|uniref:DUF659 domain-containing protein n=1 Tax=Linum tenue TaxID=586396 RepID=A0AAV0IS69_9ROSI|nr:unnamed protein product [Linum tenue]